jgi:hypothetical protein
MPAREEKKYNETNKTIPDSNHKTLDDVFNSLSKEASKAMNMESKTYIDK